MSFNQFEPQRKASHDPVLVKQCLRRMGINTESIKSTLLEGVGGDREGRDYNVNVISSLVPWIAVGNLPLQVKIRQTGCWPDFALEYAHTFDREGTKLKTQKAWLNDYADKHLIMLYIVRLAEWAALLPCDPLCKLHATGVFNKYPHKPAPNYRNGKIIYYTHNRLVPQKDLQVLIPEMVVVNGRTRQDTP